ncbi:dTDP-4-deoxyrhamnose-3,5-epimerase [Vibrio coralliirubri]|uniref:dTDP-4-dehydrorhamnose 3,5-epimerase n=1 Tax=Vibrio coralliirubri TaxID=1516159 RepID=UPI000630D563|nr:dTDP-4-dehydrorhamnose 3,5-epimerase [Vibrio coralliirubri]CDT99964.1 dTDP-4-deoxyrhamnose-3,5-epimerase [Vibrio coralliirubri]
MQVTKTKLDGVLIIEPKVHKDDRGWYSEIYSERSLENAGISFRAVQDNHIKSKKGTLRAIHFQNSPKAQAKLVRCTKGKVNDFIVDLRRSSPTFKQWIMVELTEDNKLQVLVPAGFGHGVLALEDDTEVTYKVNELYHPDLDRAICWNDPELAIDWGISAPILSEKDKNAPLLKDSDVNY